ncbi:hypothetical protein EW146_g9550 [Bondarzewia mesenterica]|uniref:Reverse transcriptase Ty1/copia-type domain-containing protein n=1 Tax=Bondarzewia mesenterica TaxID=1095465 RepID=A0A4V3XCN6_9AGAM|nr:hypothetical protein EW146_g9550 [Bondarzewia mesenterica]
MNIAASNAAEIALIKAELRTKFEIVELGPVRWLIGLAIRRDRATRTVGIFQMALINNIVSQFGLTDAHPVSTPLDHNVHLSHDDCPRTESERSAIVTIPYRQLIGSLMYLILGSRPDIAFAVSHLSQFNVNPGLRHWTAAKHVVRYLKGSCNFELTLGDTCPTEIHGYCDASFGGVPGPDGSGARRSISGFGFSFGRSCGLISWSSKRQDTTATSTSAAEYVASAHAAKEALWLQNVLELLEFDILRPSIIHCDN